MKLFLVLLALTTAIPAFADRRGSPFHPHDDMRFDELEDQMEDTTEAASLSRKQARFVYDVAVDGGSSTATKNLGVTIPAGAVFIKAMLYINTAFTDSGTGSLAIQCGGTRNILGYVDATGYSMNSLLIGGYEDSQTTAQASGVMIPGIDSGTAPTVITTALTSVTSACAVTAVVRGDAGYVPLTAGKMTGVIEYFSKD